MASMNDVNNSCVCAAPLHHVHMFQKIGLLKWCILVQRYVIPALQNCYAVLRIHYANGEIALRVHSECQKDTIIVVHNFKQFTIPKQQVVVFIEHELRTREGTLYIEHPGRERQMFRWNQIGF